MGTTGVCLYDLEFGAKFITMTLDDPEAKAGAPVHGGGAGALSFQVFPYVRWQPFACVRNFREELGRVETGPQRDSAALR